MGFFFTSGKTTIFGGSLKKFQLERMSGFEVTAVLRDQKGVYFLFFGSKFKLNFLSNFDWIFLHHEK
jgi:hypothetical protein